MKNIDNITAQIIILQNEGEKEKTLDYIFDIFDKLIINKNFNLCDSILEKLDTGILEVNSLIGILTITSEWKQKLKMREFFYQQVYSIVESKYSAGEVEQILTGLK